MNALPLIASCVGIALAVSRAEFVSAGPPSFVGVGAVPGAEATIFTRLSPNGSLAVAFSRTGVKYRFFVWTADQGFSLLPPGDWEVISVEGLSTDGSMLVGTWQPPDGLVGYFGFRYVAGKGYEFLPHNFANGVSCDGRAIVLNDATSPHTYLLVDGKETEIDAPPGEFIAYARGISGDGRVVFGGGERRLDNGGEGFWWTQGSGSQTLGDLPGGQIGTIPRASNFDGSVIVGYARSGGELGDSRIEAFLWTQQDGMLGLGDIPGGDFNSKALTVTEDMTVFGTAKDESGFVAFIWDEKGGMRELRQALADEFGLAKAVEGWRLTSVVGASADGRVIAGNGRNPKGESEAWIAHLDSTVCRADFNADSALNSQDFFDYLIAFFAGEMTADFNRDKLLNSQDFFDFLAAFFAGC